MPNTNVEITHNILVTLENRTSMMAKAIMPVLKDLKSQINKTNEQLASQCRMIIIDITYSQMDTQNADDTSFCPTIV